MKTLVKKSIYIAPYSPMSIALAKDLKDTHILGYIDRSANGDDIYRLDNVKGEYDYILIYSPNHYKAIYDEYIKHGIPSSKIILIDKDNHGYKLYKSKLSFVLKETYKNFLEKSVESICSLNIKKQDKILIVSNDFVDINSKYLFLYLLEQKADVYIATDNIDHYNLYKAISNRVILYPSLKYLYIASTSKVKVIERIITSSLIKKSLTHSHILQLWHGIALKRLNNMNGGLDLDTVVSTSSWATKHNFSHFFETNYFLESGYPRCDVFLRELSSRDYIMCDDEVLEFVENNKDKKLVIYMPTYRENSFASSPLDFEALNEFCKQKDIIFIVKMHPFELLQYFDTLKETRLSNLIFYKAGFDIYPLLKDSDILITDYSSIYFDYLLVDKPIVYFVYDKEEYISSRGKFMLDFDEYTAGDMAYTLSDLFDMIEKNLSSDEYKDKRESLKHKLFDTEELACIRIEKYLSTLH
jgi:CDP-glycerol glycerophosphotransferase (TagB/SpsB family)